MVGINYTRPRPGFLRKGVESSSGKPTSNGIKRFFILLVGAISFVVRTAPIVCRIFAPTILFLHATQLRNRKNC